MAFAFVVDPLIAEFAVVQPGLRITDLDHGRVTLLAIMVTAWLGLGLRNRKIVDSIRSAMNPMRGSYRI